MTHYRTTTRWKLPTCAKCRGVDVGTHARTHARTHTTTSQEEGEIRRGERGTHTQHAHQYMTCIYA